MPLGSHARRRGPIVSSIVTALFAVVLVASGCAVGPDPGPDAVTGGGGGGEPAESSEAPKIPELQKPAADLDWSDCYGTLNEQYDTRRVDGIRVECAELTSAIDPDSPTGDTLAVALTRIRSTATPADAAPLVLTSGSDMPSSRTAMLMAAGAGRPLLDAHPIVAIDRRGIPRSGDVDCLTRAERTVIADNGLTRGASPAARVTRLADTARSASDGCTETLDPNQMDFGVSDAASDIETLRKKWKVDHLGLIGVGEGSDVVLAYAALYGGRAGRIILDTPTAFEASARDRGQQTATGVQATLRTFALRCSSGGTCPLGPDPLATIDSVLDKARAGDLGALSDTQALSAITTAIAIAPSTPAGVADVARAIADANNGNPAALQELAGSAAGLRTTDGQLVSRCTDVSGPVGQNEIPDLIASWTKQNPLTGTDAALDLVRCTGWPADDPTAPPSSLPINPLVLNNSGDPINGGEGAGALSATLIRAGAAAIAVGWDGLGYSVAARSQCAAELIGEYVDSGTLAGPSDRTCPT